MPRCLPSKPLPPINEVLDRNIQWYGLNTPLFRCGIADQAGSVEFVFYPHFSAMSGAHTDVTEDESLMRTTLQNYGGEIAENVDAILSGRFEQVRFQCEIRTLSEVIAETGVDRIDLLKIDVEKSEWGVLQGIKSQDWDKIDQIVIEVHDRNNCLQEIIAMLEERGFSIKIDQDRFLKQSELYNIYARRSPTPVRLLQGLAGPVGSERLRRLPGSRLYWRVNCVLTWRTSFPSTCFPLRSSC